MRRGFVKAFLVATGLAYLACVALPNPTTNLPNRWFERISMVILGSLILLNTLVFDDFWVWLVLGVIFVPACLFSYFGYVQWRVRWNEGVSDVVQMTMFVWDLLISVVCLSQIF